MSEYLQKGSSFFPKFFGIIESFKSFLSKIKKNHYSKRYFIHFGIGIVVGIVVFCNFITARAEDEGSILFSLFSEEKELVVEEGAIGENLVGVSQTQNGFSRGVLKPAFSQEQEAGASKEELPTVNKNALLKPESLLTIDTSASKGKKEKKEIVYYTVEQGDTPASIAVRFGVSTNTILWANGLSEGDYIKPGEKLVILPTSGVLHKVQKGETVNQIANKYGVDSKDVIAYNSLSESGTLKIGEKIIIPGGGISASVRKIVSASPSSTSSSVSVSENKSFSSRRVSTGSGNLVWPTTTRHISQYYHWGHRAIDIDNHYQPIFAADSGYVELVGWQGGYGRIVIINHQNGMKTRYAHISKSYVKPGQKVSRGQKIARVGNTGWSTGPHLHFEVIVKGVKKNPLSYY